MLHFDILLKWVLQGKQNKSGIMYAHVTMVISDITVTS